MEAANSCTKEKRKRDIEKNYPVKQFAKKLRRLADCVEQGKKFRIQIAGERISILDLPLPLSTLNTSAASGRASGKTFVTSRCKNSCFFVEGFKFQISKSYLPPKWRRQTLPS